MKHAIFCCLLTAAALSGDAAGAASNSGNAKEEAETSLRPPWPLPKGARIVPRRVCGFAGQIALASDGSFGVSGNAEGSVRVWDFTKGVQSRLLPGDFHSLQSIAISLDGRIVIATSREKELVGVTPHEYRVFVTWNLDTDHSRHVRSK